jgi:hypothetical protein
MGRSDARPCRFFHLLDQPLGLNPIEVRKIFVGHHLPPSDDEDPLLDRRRRDQLQRLGLAPFLSHPKLIENGEDDLLDRLAGEFARQKLSMPAGGLLQSDRPSPQIRLCEISRRVTEPPDPDRGGR